MLAEYNTEFFDKILHTWLVNICKELHLHGRQHQGKQSSSILHKLVSVSKLRSIFGTGRMYKFKHAFWHGREGKSELMLSFTSCWVGELGMATPIQMHPLYVSCDTLWLTLVIRSSGTPAWDWLAALPRHSRARKVDSQHSGQSPQSGVLHCHTDTAFTHTLPLLHPENQTSYKNLSVRFKRAPRLL